MKLVNYCDKYTAMHGQQNVKICDKIYVIIFCTNFVWNISHYKKNWERYVIKNVCWCSCKLPVFLFWIF